MQPNPPASDLSPGRLSPVMIPRTPQHLIDLDTIGEPEHGPDEAAIVGKYAQRDMR
jgi:hypothetical protein